MVRKIGVWVFGTICLYIAVHNYKGFARDESAGTTGAATLVDAFEGR